jgi:DNA-binding CsgD family transcriptional regulator
LHIPDASAAQQEAYNALLRQTTSPGNAAGLLSVFWHLELEKLIPRVRCPVLVCHGRHDGVIPFEEGRRVAALLPNARFLPLQSRNHVLLGSELGWQQFLDAIDNFIPASSPYPATWDTLTPREREVVRLLAAGQTNRHIADRLRIAEKTARNHVSAIFRKLGVTSRAQAVAFARDRESGLPRQTNG